MGFLPQYFPGRTGLNITREILREDLIKDFSLSFQLMALQ
jgi:hypothetical protein